MFKVGLFGVPITLAALFFSAASFSQTASASSTAPLAAAPPPHDWTTWGYDQERSGWNRGETTLDKTNVSGLQLLWRAKLSTPPTDVALSTLTAPLVVDGVDVAGRRRDLVVMLGADDTLFALDAGSGKVVWQRTFKNVRTPQRPSNWLCPNTANDTPVIDKPRGLVFFIASDGKLRALRLSDGAERMTPTDMVAPFARTWSLNLIDNVVYTTSARGCGNIVDANSALAAASTPEPPRPGREPTTPPDPSAVSAMDVRDLAHPALIRFYTSGGRSSGPWGRGGVAKSPIGVITQTADGLYDPASGNFGSSVLELAPLATRLLDSFTAANWKYLRNNDLDLGSASLVVFRFQNRVLAASAGKEGVVYLLDTARLGGADHASPLYRSPQLGNDAAIGTEPGQGVWGAMASYVTPDGRRFLYLPMWGPRSKAAPTFKFTYGDAPHGGVMAFQVAADGEAVTLIPQWMSPDMTVPDPPVVANGVVYALQTGEQTLQYRRAAPGAAREPPGPGAGAAFRATPVSHLVLYALDAETGKPLYSSQDLITGWTHFSEPVVALGKVFVETHDGGVYAFGLPSKRAGN